MFGRLCANTTCHGFGRFHKAKNKGDKGLWLFIILFSLCGTVYVGVNIIRSFLLSPFANILRLEARSSVQLPSVMICPIPPWANETKLQEYGLNISIIREIVYWESTIFSNNITDQQVIAADALFHKIQSKTMKKPKSDLIVEVGIPCELFFVRCVRQYFNTYDCCSHWKGSADYFGKKCFRYNSELLQSYPGVRFGHHLELRLPPMTEMERLSSYGVGVKLYSEMGSEMDSEVLISPGSDSKIVLQREEKRMVNSWLLTNCDPTLRFHQSVQDCLTVHELSRYAKECGCYSSVYSVQRDHSSVDNALKNLSDCSPNDTRHCAFPIWKDTRSRPPSCLPSCTQIYHKKTVSSAGISWSKPMDMEESLRHIRISIGFETLNVKVIQEVSTMTPESVVGNLGGAFFLEPP